MLKKLLLIMILVASSVMFAACESKESNNKNKEKSSSSDTTGTVDIDETAGSKDSDKNDDKGDDILKSDSDIIAKTVYTAVISYCEKCEFNGYKFPDGTYTINITAPLDSSPDYKLCQTDTENQLAIAVGSALDEYADGTYAEVVIENGFPTTVQWSKTEGGEFLGSYPKK